LRSLIDLLLLKDPRHRLGSGAYGSSNDARAIFRHEFFEGVDF